MGGLGFEYEVTKAIIVVAGQPNHYLMSIKRDPGSSNEGKLEFLGGRMERDESPSEAVVRELREEEATGALAKLLKAKSPLHIQHQVKNAMHYFFPFEISEADYERLKHDPLESHGFCLVNGEQLQQCNKRYTRKTNGIIEILDLPSKIASGASA